jgi:mono/diheme cytochrome c family protein
MSVRRFLYFVLIGALGIAAAQAGSNWHLHVSQPERAKVNPYAGQPDAIAAGKGLFREYCAQCHASDALGKNGRPSLRTKEVQHSSDGELLWLLRNGDRTHGMPSWNSLPEQMRWQIGAYVKSLGVSGPRRATTRQLEEQ